MGFLLLTALSCLGTATVYRQVAIPKDESYTPAFPFLLPLFFSEAESFRLLCCFAGEAARQPLSFGFAAVLQGTKTKAFTCPAAFKGQAAPSACSCFHLFAGRLPPHGW